MMASRMRGGSMHYFAARTCQPTCRRTVATSAASPTTQPQQSLQELQTRLLQHVQTAGGQVADGVQLRVSVQGPNSTVSRTLLATKDVLPGTPLVTVPRSCQLRYDDARDPRLLSLFERIPPSSTAAGATGAWQFKQALLLLWHLSQPASSPLSPHLALLPGICPGLGPPRIGMLLHDSAVEELQHAPLIQDVLNHKYWLRSFHEQELEPLRGTSPFNGMAIDRTLFGTAVACSMSRCFGLRKIGTHSMPAVIDMADHVEDSNCEITSDPETGAITMSTKSQVKAGEHLTLTYGPHSNADLLLSYGFILPVNRNDSFDWDFDVDTMAEVVNSMCGDNWIEMPLPPWKQQALQQLGLVSGASIQLPGGSAPTPSSQQTSNTLSGALSSGSSNDAVFSSSSSNGPDHGAGAFSPTVDGHTSSSGGHTSEAHGVSQSVTFRGHAGPPVDQRLLAATRVLLLRKGDGEKVLSMMQGLRAASGTNSNTAGGSNTAGTAAGSTGGLAEQLGSWENPIARQHEACVMQALSALVTAIYQSFPTSIQQDKAVQQQLAEQLAKAHAILASNKAGQAQPQVLEVLDQLESVSLAVEYRLSLKRNLEACLQKLRARKKELDTVSGR